MQKTIKKTKGAPKFFEAANLFLTYPQWKSKLDVPAASTIEHYYLIDTLKERVKEFGSEIDQFVVAREEHEQSGYHFHVYIHLVQNIKNRGADLMDIDGNHPNIQKPRSVKDVINYCRKDNYFIQEINEIPIRPGKKSNRTIVCERLVKGEKLSTIVDEIPQTLYDFKKLQENYNLYSLSKVIPESTPETKGIWIYGESGVGKSFGVRKFFDGLGHRVFNKPANIWWDGYSGEPIVLIDDLDTDFMSHQLKIWMDHYACFGQIKGGTVPLMFKYLVVTSNRTIEDLFANKPHDLIPIKRRCQVGHIIIPKSFPRLSLANLDVVDKSKSSSTNPPQLSDAIFKSIRDDVDSD